jgi:hypothetical protein
MSRVDNINFLIQLAEERGIEIRCSRLSYDKIFLSGALSSALFGYICGYRCFYWSPLILTALGGFAATKIYGIFPSLKYPLSVFLEDHLTPNEKKQLCTKMRMGFKDLTIPSNSEPNAKIDETTAGETGSPDENRKQEIVEKILEFLREKFNVMSIDM